METNIKSVQEYFEHVRSSGLYGDFYSGITDYGDAPILEKEKLQSILLSNFDLHAEARGVYLVRSGGSTQKPLIFPVDIEENLEQRRRLANELLAAKILSPKTIAMNLFSYGLIYRTAAIMDDILEKSEATTLPLSAEAKNADVHESILHLKPNMIMGSPSRLILFANYLREQSLRVDVPAVLFGGEYLFPSAVPLFNEYFGTKQIFALFGSAESGIWAWSDYSREPSMYRVLNDIHVEIADPDPEGFGRVIITNLMRKRFPVFRYEIGDIGKLIRVDEKQFLQLKSRVQNSFSIDSTKFYVEDFGSLTADADSFQLQLSSDAEGRQILTLLLVKNMQMQEQEMYASKKQNELNSIMHFSKDSVELQLRLVAPDELYRNKVTSKTPQLVDFRS